MSDRTRRVSFEDYSGTDTFRILLPSPPPISDFLLKDLPPSASPREVVHRVAQAADTADFARVNLSYSPKDQKLLEDQARRSLEAAWANPVAAAALRSAGIVETASRVEYAAGRYDDVASKLDNATSVAAKLSAFDVAANVGNPGSHGRDQTAPTAGSRSFGEEYRERLIALGRAQEHTSIVREEVQEAQRDVQESKPAETARRGRGR